jgi:serine/threonine protein kinase
MKHKENGSNVIGNADTKISLTNNSSNNNSSSKAQISLQQLLKDADLLEYHDKLKTVLKLRHAGDLAFTDAKDLTDLGMSRPEQRRLHHEYLKYFPQQSVFGKLKKVFGKNDKTPEYVNTASSPCDENQHVIPASNIQLCKELGVGEFGHVYLSAWTQPNGEIIQVAVKRVPPEKLIANPTSFLQEAAIMTKMRHENVVRLYGVVLDTKSVMLVSELAPCGSLLECCQKPALRTSFPVDVLCSFSIQIAKGMQYLASERLIHRDLAARNVLVFSAEKVKISDFGLSRSLGVGEDYYRSEFNPAMKLPIAWCSPESINYLRFTEKSDVWSFAVTLWEMFSYGMNPWNGYTGAQILSAIDHEGQRLEIPESCPIEFYNIMQKCWLTIPDDRPTFDQLVSCLPDLMPQLLITVSEQHYQEKSLLSFNRNEVIILLNRCPSGVINGEYWLGAMRNGSVGLFKPAETVAYLGAESPVANQVTFRAPVIKKKDIKVSKVPPEKKKLLISEPQGDVRHTCHVGIDGTSFGILEGDKNLLSKALPPPFPTTNGDAKMPPRPAPRRNPTLPNAAPVSPGTPVRHISSEKNIILPTGDKSPPILFPRNRALSPPSPPSLPPKPAPTRSSALVIENKMISPSSTLNRRTVAGDIAAEFRDRKEQLLNLPSDYSFPSGNTTTTSSSTISSHPESVLDQVLLELQQDITNFSMISSKTSDSIDFSDTRPLLNGSKGGGGYTSSLIDTTDGVLAEMNDKEFEAFQKRASHEKAKAAKELEKQRTLDRKASKASLLKKELSEEMKQPPKGQFSSKITEPRQKDEWSPEAQEAYKLLVSCGNRLKSTSPLPDKRSNSSSRSSTSTELTIIAGTQYTRASAPPEEDTLERNYENRPKVSLKAPPNVLPKPKMDHPIEARRIDNIKF